MKTKTVIVISLLVVTTIMVTQSQVSSGLMYNETSDEDTYYYEDVDVFIIGRCRTTVSTGLWTTGLYVGFESYVGIGATLTPLERLHIIVKDGLTSKIFPILMLVGVDMNNAEGIFFAGITEQYSAGLIPFIVFVRCHAERLWIHDYHLFP